MALTFTRDLDPLTSSGLELDDPSRDLRGRDVLSTAMAPPSASWPRC